DVEQQHGGQVDVADDGKDQVQAVGGQEGLGRPPDRHGGGARGQQAHGDPVLRMDAGPRFDPDDAADHVLQDDGGGHDQPADESAARQVVPAYQEIQGDQGGHGQQQAHEHGGHFHDAVRNRRLGVGVGEGVQQPVGRQRTLTRL